MFWGMQITPRSKLHRRLSSHRARATSEAIMGEVTQWTQRACWCKEVENVVPPSINLADAADYTPRNKSHRRLSSHQARAPPEVIWTGEVTQWTQKSSQMQSTRKCAPTFNQSRPNRGSHQRKLLRRLIVSAEKDLDIFNVITIHHMLFWMLDISLLMFCMYFSSSPSYT